MKNDKLNAAQSLCERKIEGESIYNGKVLHLVRDKIELSDGSTSYREVIRHNGAVCVLPLTDDGKVACVTQYRYAIGRLTLELPAGKLDGRGEDPESAARRELREETGYECDKMTYLGAMYGSPAILDEVIHLYLATGLTRGEACPDEGEFVEVSHHTLEEMGDMIAEGRIKDAKTQIAVLKVLLGLKNKKERN